MGKTASVCLVDKEEVSSQQDNYSKETRLVFVLSSRVEVDDFMWLRNIFLKARGDGGDHHHATSSLSETRMKATTQGESNLIHHRALIKQQKLLHPETRISGSSISPLASTLHHLIPLTRYR